MLSPLSDCAHPTVPPDHEPHRAVGSQEPDTKPGSSSDSDSPGSCFFPLNKTQ